MPHSANSAALGYSEASGIPLDWGFIANPYVGRTFIQPEQALRKFGVEIKLAVVPEVVRGRRVVVVDDSIVRGTTTRAKVQKLREAGAREVHMRISCPPLRWPCFYGVDFATREELIAVDRDVEEIRRILGLDSLGYLSVKGMVGAAGGRPDRCCLACYTGEYPVPVRPGANKFQLERGRKAPPADEAPKAEAGSGRG
jgi:amidophosphoribosyltransferase